MNIQSIIFTNAGENKIASTLANGSIRHTDYPPDDRYADEVQEWLDAGNVIPPFVEPPIDPKDQERIDAIASLKIARADPANTDVTPVQWGDLRLILDAMRI